jgi:hypothetical protein
MKMNQLFDAVAQLRSRIADKTVLLGRSDELPTLDAKTVAESVLECTLGEIEKVRQIEALIERYRQDLMGPSGRSLAEIETEIGVVREQRELIETVVGGERSLPLDDERLSISLDVFDARIDDLLSEAKAIMESVEVVLPEDDGLSGCYQPAVAGTPKGEEEIVFEQAPEADRWKGIAEPSNGTTFDEVYAAALEEIDASVVESGPFVVRAAHVPGKMTDPNCPICTWEERANVEDVFSNTKGDMQKTLEFAERLGWTGPAMVMRVHLDDHWGLRSI